MAIELSEETRRTLTDSIKQFFRDERGEEIGLLSLSPLRLVESLERVEVHSVEALRAWFRENHAQPQSVWLVTWKKATPEKYVSTDEVLDEALCFGWIDGRRKKLDALRTMQLLSPRKASHWAQSYKERVRRLTEEGRMHPPGMRVVEEAKASGMWDFMNDVDALIVPPDLAAALDESPSARRAYEEGRATVDQACQEARDQRAAYPRGRSESIEGPARVRNALVGLAYSAAMVEVERG